VRFRLLLFLSLFFLFTFSPGGDFFGEACGDDGCGERDKADAADSDCAAQELAEGRDGVDVAVADGGERDDGPPERGGDAGEFVRLGGMLGVVHQARCDNQRDEHEHKDDAKLRAPASNHPAQHGNRGGVAPKLEDPQNAQEAQGEDEAEIGCALHSKVQVEGGDGEQIDNGERSNGKTQAAEWALISRIFNARPESQEVLCGEDCNGGGFEGEELAPPDAMDFRLGFEHDGDDAEDDQEDHSQVKKIHRGPLGAPGAGDEFD